MAFLDREELLAVGFAAVGADVLVSARASIYNPARIVLGSRVRIDDFAILSAGEGGIEVGDRVHIACHTTLIGAGRIELRDFANISGHVAIYSSSDDFSGGTLTGPLVPRELRAVDDARVVIGRHVVVGASSVILPGVTLGDGCCVGALSLVRSDCEPLWIYGGVPAQKLKPRRTDFLTLEGRLDEPGL